MCLLNQDGAGAAPPGAVWSPRWAHLVPPSSQDAESKEHGRDADEQLQNQEDHQGAQDPVDQQLVARQEEARVTGGPGGGQEVQRSSRSVAAGLSRNHLLYTSAPPARCIS